MLSEVKHPPTGFLTNARNDNNSAQNIYVLQHHDNTFICQHDLEECANVKPMAVPDPCTAVCIQKRQRTKASIASYSAKPSLS